MTPKAAELAQLQHAQELFAAEQTVNPKPQSLKTLNPKPLTPKP
jgi:hypothetical protein